MTRLLWLLALLASALPAKSQDARVAGTDALPLDRIRRLVVLENQRYKPFDSLAREWVERITGKEPYLGQDSVIHYLHWIFEPELARTRPYIKLSDAESLRSIGIEPDRSHTHASLDELLAHPSFLEAAREIDSKRPEARSSRDRQILALANRAMSFVRLSGLDESAESGHGSEFLPFIPPAPPHRPDAPEPFRSPAQAGLTRHGEATLRPMLGAYERLRTAFRARDAQAFGEASGELVTRALAAGYPTGAGGWPGPELVEREIAFSARRPFHRTTWIYFGAFLAALLAVGLHGFPAASRSLQVLAIAGAAAGIGLHAWGLVDRTAISGRAMVGTFYESMLFSAGVAALGGIILEMVFRNRWFVLAGTLGGSMALFVATHNPDFMQPAISTLVPVLDNNDWIYIHVPTVMVGYSILFLAVLLGHIYLLRWLWLGEEHPSQRALARTMFWTIPPGEVVLVAGIILGGIWADDSWGRFWGWDPKEVGSLILWLVFMVVIHGRLVGWLRDFGTAVGTIAGSLALFWSYYGTNFFWTGKHSYAEAGGSQSIPAWMVWYLGIELGLLALVFGRRALRRRAPPTGVAA
jgi:ABC-type transport system involved in cytochrome c biogenesis permease subunit